uniref:CSON011667 protein n=1 Tax=Culicoides sonorensis TaxID=179676 RepID=A0A336N4B9_CULSO
MFTCFEVGNYIIISTTEKVAITTGILTKYDSETIEICTDRNLKYRFSNSSFIIDSFSGRNLLSLCYGNLAMLFENTPSTNYLRKIITGQIPPEFASDVAIDLKINLSDVQRNIVYQALNCKNYMLIKGYAGCGKTETIVAIITSFYKIGKSVIITSNTHSAIDNILLRLKKNGIQFIRMGKTAKMMSEILEYSEAALCKNCQTPEDFESLYNKYVS